jgi:hypothetical protein
MLAFVTIIDKKKTRWLAPLLALFTLGTHLILVFFYFPLIAIVLLYPLLVKDEAKTFKSSLALLLITIALSGIAFLLFLLLRSRTFVFPSARDFANAFRSKTDLPLNTGAIYDFMYASLGHHLQGWHTQFNRWTFTGVALLAVIINLPLLFMFVVFWLRCIAREISAKGKFFFALPILSLVYQAVVFFMFTDFGRWLCMIAAVQFMLLFYLLYRRNPSVLEVCRIGSAVVKKHRFLILSVCILTAFLGPVNAMTCPDRVAAFVKFLLKGMGVNF